NPSDYLYPYNRYTGRFDPQHLAFNANLQEFAQRVSYVSCLQTGGKLTPEDAFERIEHLWEQLQRSRESLCVESER
ncbi:MAG: hypothetical protein AAFY15_12630, partial [Cyanobacteria bacterium J06648_11]